MKKKKEETGFHVYDFMNGLELTRSTRDVYALLYSFSSGVTGLYYGSQETLGEMLGISRRTVISAYKRLSQLGLIERVSVGKYVGIRAKPPADAKMRAEQKSENARPRTADGKSEKSTREVTESRRPTESARELIISKVDTYPSLYNNPSPKYKPQMYGTKGMVALTRDQYDKLCELVPTETVDHYIEKFQLMLQRNMDHPGSSRAPHSHYRTIKSWLHKDFGT